MGVLMCIREQVGFWLVNSALYFILMFCEKKKIIQQVEQIVVGAYPLDFGTDQDGQEMTE